ncbi:hypothetical protein D1872_326300 [compost metagenome]
MTVRALDDFFDGWHIRATCPPAMPRLRMQHLLLVRPSNAGDQDGGEQFARFHALGSGMRRA